MRQQALPDRMHWVFGKGGGLFSIPQRMFPYGQHLAKNRKEWIGFIDTALERVQRSENGNR